MDFGISTQCFGTTPLTPAALETLVRAEFSNIELFACLPAFNYRSRPILRQTAQWFADHELPPPTLHLPFSEDVLADRPLDRQWAHDDLKRCLELGDLLPLRWVVLHLGAPGQRFNPVYFDHAYAAVSMIQGFSGIPVLLETLPNEIATFRRIEEFRSLAQIPEIEVCYDTGHGELEGQAQAIHMNDNLGDGDAHLLPFEGDRNWPALVELIVRTGFQGPVILESQDSDLVKAAQARSRLMDMIEEAQSSLEEFRLRHRLREPLQGEDS